MKRSSEMKTIGDLVKKMKEEGREKDAIFINLSKKVWGSIYLSPEDLEEFSPELTIEECLEQNVGDFEWNHNDRIHSFGEYDIEYTDKCE